MVRLHALLSAGAAAARARAALSLGIAMAAIVLASPACALEKVSLQLKWRHQFQFAGYYMALEKGYYRAAGLDVDIREGGPGIDAIKDLGDGKADFGVCTTSVLLAKPFDPKLVVLAVVFQHSAAVILTPSRSRITSPSELKSRWLMDTPGSDDLAAMLKHEGVEYAALPRVIHEGNPMDLVNGKADAMVAYSTNEPFFLEQQGIPYRTFAPRTFGFDFYGDALCASAEGVKRHPERSRAFRAATLQGWEYALANKEETVDIVVRQYPVAKGRDALLFEASRTEALVQPKLIPLGSQTIERWQKIANIYRDLGMLSDPRIPDGLVYEAEDARMPVWQKLSLLAAGVLLLAVVAGVLGWRRLMAYLDGSGAKPKLSAVMAALFVCLSIPILIFILSYNHYRNSEAILENLQEQVRKSRHASVDSVETLMRSVSSMLGLLAEAASIRPTYFRTENSRDALYRVLTSSKLIDAAYVSFEDGYHRVVTRVDDDRKRSDPQIPENANWHSSYVDEFAVKDRLRRRTFFDVWPNNIAQYSVPSTLDVTKLPGYAEARDSGTLFVTEPTLNPDTGYPVIFARVPIVREGEFIGCATVNITFDILSQFLTAQRPSENSLTLIADAINGQIIASSERSKGVRVVDGKLQIAKLENIADDDVREAYRLHVQTNRDELLFRSPRDGRELSASFARLTESYGHPWQWVTITPTDDFVGQLKATNQQIIFIIIGLTAIELLLIYGLARRLSQPIENITRQLESVEALSFGHSELRVSKIREIARLQSAATLLSSSLQSFSSFAPVDLVRGLVKSGIPLALGVESRQLTVLFSDLEGFSTHAERLDLNDLLQQTSVYFEQVSRAIADEKGTVDKFIGDGVMAFWNAPMEASEHALHACKGALRAIRRMEAVNKVWEAEGKAAFRIRIGLNTDNSLVGNIGSSDRFSYTAIGDGVNVAARLEGVNKQFGTAICISDSVLNAAGPSALARPLRIVQVKGRKQEFMIYELLGIAGSDDPELAPRADDARLAEMTRAASAAFERGDKSVAARLYEEILAHFPNDPVATSMLEACGVVPEVAVAVGA
jgi:class 3 adenylate cyclase/ABC-type nitrate/sulfonate/bicarbonate transport system substrate-binding protein